MSGVLKLKNPTIEFSPKEAKQLEQIIQCFVKNPYNNLLKTTIVDMFTPKIEHKAAAIAANSKGKVSAVDFAQDLYLKLLESIDALKRQTKPQASAIIKAMNKRRHTADTLISCADKSLDNMLPEETTKILSEKVNERAENFGDYIKDSLIPLQKKVLTDFLEGKSFSETGFELGIPASKAEAIFDVIVKKLQNPAIKNKLRRFYYEDTTLPAKVIPADKPLFDIPKKPVKIEAPVVLPENTRNYTADEVWEMIQADLPPINLEEELDTIMKTQTNMSGLFSNPPTRAKFMKNYNGYKFKIKLPRRCDTPEIKAKITQLVTDKFGWNIFEFV